MKRFILFLLSTLLLSACMPGNLQLPQMQQDPLLPMLERKSGLIAYIGTDGNIYTSDQAGNNVTAYTRDAQLPANATDPYHYYVYPAWAPNSQSIGFVGVTGQGTKATTDVYIAKVKNNAQKVFSSDSEHPIYLYWSPDNTNLSFLSSTADGKSMIVQSVSSAQKERTIIDTGTPYYWSWAPDGKTMIAHAGSAGGAEPEHLAFVKVGSNPTEDGLDISPTSFQSPAWSPDGSRILMTRTNDQNKKEIIITDGQGKFEKAIGTFAMNTAFAWSDQSDKVAYIEGKKTTTAGALGALHVVDVNTSKELFKVDEDVFAFFWSPDGQKIAYFIPKVSSDSSSSNSSSGQSNSSGQTQQQVLLQLKILDVNSGKSKDLLTFTPTDQFVGILPYFDQYHQSATIWSPDNYNLVLSLFASDSTPSIAVVPASGQLQPRVIAHGYLGFWSRN